METISSKTLLAILNKTAFAKRCGVSVPTVYAWIKKNHDGIGEYVTDNGIKGEIFLREPWTRFVEQTEAQPVDVDAELDAARNQIDALRRDLELKDQQIDQLNKMLEMVQAQLTVKDQQINALLVSLNQQIKALPQPKKHWWQRRKTVDENA